MGVGAFMPLIFMMVAMFGILSSSLSAAISRFITFELGKGDYGKLKILFCTSVNIQIILISIITVLLESVGLWFLNYKMVIPEERLVAANWVFQFSVITFAVNLLSVPYNATIIAHEKMSAFAYISIVDAFLKLVVALIITYSPFDRLIYYGLLIMIVGIVNRVLYGLYCKKHFQETEYHFVFDKGLMKEMFEFAGWNFFGSGSSMLMKQGVNILLNVFFGVAVNAARGIAVQVDAALNAFVNNFTTALNPQIIKSYAQNDKEYMFRLLFSGAKLSYFLVLLFAMPLICETDFILTLWLKNYPPYALVFVRLTIIMTMIFVLTNTLITAMNATGNIRNYQLIVGGLGMLVFPLSWIFFYLGYPPEMAYITNIIIFIFQLVSRVLLLKKRIGMPIKQYFQEVLLRTQVVTVLVFLQAYCLLKISATQPISFLLVVGLGSVISLILIYYVGLSRQEKDLAKKLSGLLCKKFKGTY